MKHFDTYVSKLILKTDLHLYTRTACFESYHTHIKRVVVKFRLLCHKNEISNRQEGMQVKTSACARRCLLFFVLLKQGRSSGFRRGKCINYGGGSRREEPERLPRGFHDTRFPSYPFEKRVTICAQSRACARADCAVGSGEGSAYFFRVIGMRPENHRSLLRYHTARL